MMEALSQTWNNSRKVAKCWEFDMVQNAFCCFTFFFAREKLVSVVDFVFKLHKVQLICSWFLTFDIEQKTRHQFKTSEKRVERWIGIYKIEIHMHLHTICSWVRSLAQTLQIEKKMYSSHLNIAYIPSIPSLRFLSQLKRLTSLRLLSATNVRDEIEFLWSTFTWVEQFNIWII